MRVVSFVGNAWVWGSMYDLWRNTPADRIPVWIALPWYLLAERLGTTPSLSYAWYCLHNWQLINPEQPISLENTALINNFLGGFDEEGFVKIHLVIEDRWSPLPAASISIMQALAKDGVSATLGMRGYV